MTEDIRWKQRFSNYKDALSRLTDAVELSRQRELSDLEKQGLIQAFEFTHELAWKVLKDFLVYQGISEIIGSRDAVREAFKLGLLDDGEVWMSMIKSRNESSHTYNLATAEVIVKKVIEQYHSAFIHLENLLKLKAS